MEDSCVGRRRKRMDTSCTEEVSVGRVGGFAIRMVVTIPGDCKVAITVISRAWRYSAIWGVKQLSVDDVPLFGFSLHRKPKRPMQENQVLRVHQTAHIICRVLKKDELVLYTRH